MSNDFETTKTPQTKDFFENLLIFCNACIYFVIELIYDVNKWGRWHLGIIWTLSPSRANSVTDHYYYGRFFYLFKSLKGWKTDWIQIPPPPVPIHCTKDQPTPLQQPVASWELKIQQRTTTDTRNHSSRLTELNDRLSDNSGRCERLCYYPAISNQYANS